MKDENDRLLEGTLPSDPTADAEPMMSPAQKELRDGAPAVGDLVVEALGRMRRRAQGIEKPIPLPWEHLGERLSGGLWPGCHVLVGNTGTGKSQWALQAVLHAARQGVPCLYVGLELGKVDLVARLLGLMSNKRWSRLYLGADGGELEEVTQRHQAELEKLPIHLATPDSFGWSYGQLGPAARLLAANYPDQDRMLVVVDYLQLVASPKDKPGQSIRERIGAASYAARDVARKHNASVLLLSSTARNNYELVGGQTSGSKEKPAWERPAGTMVGLGKESGEVEFSADTVLALVREPWGEGDPPTETTMHLALAKQRIGATSWLKLEFNGGRFREQWSQPAERTLGSEK